MSARGRSELWHRLSRLVIAIVLCTVAGLWIRLGRPATDPVAEIHGPVEKTSGDNDPSEAIRGPGDDWKSSLRGQVLRHREFIENTSELSALHRSMCQAYVARVLNSIEDQKAPDEALLAEVHAIGRAMEEACQGGMPPVPKGESKLEVELEGTGLVQFTLVVPESYSRDYAWPLLVGEVPWKPFEWPGSKCIWLKCAPQPATIRQLLGVLEGVLRIDRNRIYMAGDCWSAHYAADCLHYCPDLWAAAVIVRRVKWSPLWANVASVPVRCYVPYCPDDEIVSTPAIEYLRRVGCDVEYIPYPTKAHVALPPEYSEPIMRWLFEQRRGPCPSEVNLLSDGHHPCTSWWASIDEIEEPEALGRLSARISRETRTVNVSTSNVGAYALALDRTRFESGVHEITVLENGRPAGNMNMEVDRFVFRRKRPEVETGLKKRPNMAGPIGGALSRPCLIVWGDGGADRGFARVCSSAAGELHKASWLPASPPPLSDQTACEDSVRKADLILIGTPETNRWIDAFADKLPVSLTGERITAQGIDYDANKVALFLVYPNPLNPDKYVFVLSSASAEILQYFAKRLCRSTGFVGAQDILIGEPDSKFKNTRWHVAERFASTWTWPQPQPALAHLRDTHPDEQWEQLAANVMCDQGDADVLVFTRISKLPPSSIAGPVTARTIYRFFSNAFLIRAELPGNALAQLDKSINASGGRCIGFERNLDRRTAGAANQTLYRILIPHDANRELFAVTSQCELTDLRVADTLVRHLEQLPGMDLDSELSRHTQDDVLRTLLAGELLMSPGP